MNLQTILYGQFTPPPVGKVRRHTILQDSSKPLPRYVPKTPRPNEQLKSAEKMLRFIRKNPGACARDIQEHLSRAISYVYRIRDILISQNKIYGVRGKPIKRGGPKTTLFYAKD